jgi:nicotinamidase/pyrazinamidase
VQDTEGAQLHPSIDRDKIDVVVDKGERREIEGYSAFEETELEQMLRDNGVGRVTVVGLATDYCVRASALHALERGFEVAVDREGVRGIDAEEGDSERALDEIRTAGGVTR